MWARSLGLGFLIGFLLSFLGVAAAASQPAGELSSEAARLRSTLAGEATRTKLLNALPREARRCRWPALI